MSRCNESKVTSAGSFFNFAGFADHAGQCCSQTLLNKTCCVLFCVLSRRDISHRSFDGDAWIVYRQQRMNVGAKDSPKWEPEQLIAFQSGFRTTVALNQPVHRTFDLFNVSQPFSCQTEMCASLLKTNNFRIWYCDLLTDLKVKPRVFSFPVSVGILLGQIGVLKF